MELDICSLESCKKQKSIDLLHIQEQQKNIKELQEKIEALTQKMNQKPYEIKIDTNMCARLIKGAGAGSCAGFLSGSSCFSVYGFADKYAWCCWNISTPSKILCDMITIGLPICTLVGCICGTCCVLNKCDEKIKIIVD